jgi:hypothetical protein
MGGLKQTSPTNAIFFFIIEVKTCWRVILTCCLKNWMQKDKDKWPPNHLSWKKWAHSLMKWSMSCPGSPCTSMVIGIKWYPSWNPLHLWMLAMALSFTFALISRLMTFEAIVFHVRLIPTTLVMKTWSFWVVQKLAHNETPDVRAYCHFLHIVCPLSWAKAYMTFWFMSCIAICWPPNEQRANVC